MYFHSAVAGGVSLLPILSLPLRSHHIYPGEIPGAMFPFLSPSLDIVPGADGVCLRATAAPLHALSADSRVTFLPRTSHPLSLS